MCDVFQLPPKIEFNGDFKTFLDEVYNVFKIDFIDSKPIFNGKRLGLKKMPYVDGFEATFYHLTHEGKVEQDRKPNLERMARIPFPRPLIENSNHPYLKVWRNERKNETRILIYHTEEKYLAVLADRGKYILPWTAYLITYPNQEKKLMKEYEVYKSQNRSG